MVVFIIAKINYNTFGTWQTYAWNNASYIETFLLKILNWSL